MSCASCSCGTPPVKQHSATKTPPKVHSKVDSCVCIMPPKPQLFLLSSGMVQNYGLFDFAKDDLLKFFESNNVKTILFVPYAKKDYNDYLKQIDDVFSNWGYKVEGIHNHSDPVEAVKNAQLIYIGGGNTFLLLKTLYDKNLMEPIRKRVVQDGIPYMGSSAGTNVSTIGIQTTNDMPIVHPPSFDGLKLVPFNINPHYQDPDPYSSHKGETRPQRIEEYITVCNAKAVLALREGTFLRVSGTEAHLGGIASAKIFYNDKKPVEVQPGEDLSDLLKIRLCC